MSAVDPGAKTPTRPGFEGDEHAQRMRAVLAKVAERRALAEQAAAELPQEDVLDVIRRQNRERAAARAEAAGQLDLSRGDSTP